MLKNRVQTIETSMAEKRTSKMSRVVSVETPDYRDGTIATYNSTIAAPRRELEIEEEGAPGSTLRVIQSPMDALRIGMASPFRNFLGLLKPPPLPGSSLHGSSDLESPRASTDSGTEIESLCVGSLKPTVSGAVDMSGEISINSSNLNSKLYETRREGQNVVIVAFDANVKEVSHTGIVWAMEHVLKRGDILTIVSVLDSVRGALGYRVKIGDHKWLSANQKLIEEEIQQKMEVWRSFPALDRRCEEGGVKLVVMVKAAQRGELAICKEAMKLGACHVVLDKSLKNRHRAFYMQNLSCNVTRMRRSGGVDVIRPSLDMATMMGLVPRSGKFPEPRSPTSVIPPPLLSYGDQIDEFEICLRAPKPKRLPSTAAKSNYNPGDSKSTELRRLSSSAILATAHERASSISTSTQERPSSVSTSSQERPSSVSTPSLRESITSSSNATDHDMDDDLFSIFHGSTRHTDIDAFSNLNPGYESDDLFSIGNASTRHTSPPPTLDHRPIPDTAIVLRTARLSTDAIIPLSSELVITEPLRQATISRITFVVGLGEAVTLTLRSPLRPGEGLLVGSSPSALFLMHTDRDQNATLTTATPNSYIAMEGKMAMKLSFLEPDQRVLAVDSFGRCRTIRVQTAATQKKPLVLVEAHCEGRRHGVLLHHTETVGLRHSLGHGHGHSQSWGGGEAGRMVSVKGLKVGDRVLLRLRSAEPSHAIWSS